MQQTWVQSLGQEDSVEEEMVTHSSILTWGIPQTEKAFGLYSPWGHKKLNMTEWLNNNNNNKNHWEGKRREIVPARTARPTAGKLPPLRTSPEILSKKKLIALEPGILHCMIWMGLHGSESKSGGYYLHCLHQNCLSYPHGGSARATPSVFEKILARRKAVKGARKRPLLHFCLLYFAQVSLIGESKFESTP